MTDSYINILPFIELLRKSNLEVSTAESILAQQIINLGYFNTSEVILRSALQSALIRKQNDIDIFDLCFDIFFQIDSNNSYEKSVENVENSTDTNIEKNIQNKTLQSLINQKLDLENLLANNNGNAVNAIPGRSISGFNFNLGTGTGLKSSNTSEYNRSTVNIQFIRWIPAHLRTIALGIIFDDLDKNQLIELFINQILNNNQHFSPQTLANRFNRFTNQLLRAYQMTRNEIVTEDFKTINLTIIGELDLLLEKIENFIRQSRRKLLSGQYAPVEDLLKYFHWRNLIPDKNDFLKKKFSDLRMTLEDVEQELFSLGKHLAILERRRRQLAMKGKIDFRRTMRENISNGGMLLNIRTKKRRIQDPKIILLSDVSLSCEWVSEWFFIVCYAAQTVWKKIFLFEFDNTTVEITHALKKNTIRDALKFRSKAWEHPLRPRLDHSNYETALEDFYILAHSNLHFDTTLIILGDCRDWLGQWLHSNDKETSNIVPRSKVLLERIKQRVKQIIILNPEQEQRWNTGDSIVKHFQKVGAKIYYVENLLSLINFIFKIKA